MILEPGQEIERYVVDGVLGQGGMAAVYRVRHQTLGSMYALKVLSVPSKSVRARMLQEGRIQASIRSTNIVRVVDVLDVGGMMGLLMEYVKGPSLADLLRAHHLDLDEALTIFGGILSGVEVAHDRDLIHRDLKPANILLSLADDGLWPKVTDFGIAKGGETAEPVDVTRPGSTMGTPAYMSPDQIHDASNVDKRADMWSLGCILYELVCHQRAFPGEHVLDILNSVVRGEFTPPRELAPHLPDRVLKALDATLVMDKEARVPDCRSLAAILAEADEVAAVNQVMPVHLPRSSSTVAVARSLAFKTPSPASPREFQAVSAAESAPTSKPQTWAANSGDTAPPRDSGPSLPREDSTLDDQNMALTSGGVDSTIGFNSALPGMQGAEALHADLDSGVERLSTEEVHQFREATGQLPRATRSRPAYAGPLPFFGLPIELAFLAVMVFAAGLGTSIHYYRVVSGLHARGTGASVAAHITTPDEDADIEDASSRDAHATNRPPVRESRETNRDGKTGSGPGTSDARRSMAALDALPDPASETDTSAGTHSTAEPDLSVPRKQWGRVKVTGDAKRLEFRANGKTYNPYGKIAPGEYDIVAFFTEDDPVHAGRIFIGRNDQLQLRCSVIWKTCRLQ